MDKSVLLLFSICLVLSCLALSNLNPNPNPNPKPNPNPNPYLDSNPIVSLVGISQFVRTSCFVCYILVFCLLRNTTQMLALNPKPNFDPNPNPNPVLYYLALPRVV
jgi:hypothetical protein